MADAEGNSSAKNFHLGTPPAADGFYVKGAANCDWGTKNRLARMFGKKSGNTVMLAFDHGYIMGPTSGLERLDVSIPPLIPHVDVLMANRGGIRACVSASLDKPVCLRVNYDASVIHEDMSQGGGIACDMRNAVRMNAVCVAVQSFIGTDGEKNSLGLVSRMVDAGSDYGVPVMGVVAVGKQMERNEKFFLLATRILAELGVQIVKSYYCEGFERVAAACPVPIVIAGGKKLPEADALNLAYRAISDGARGVDMGRNIFQAENPAAMCMALSKIVHDGLTGKEAAEFYSDNVKSL